MTRISWRAPLLGAALLGAAACGDKLTVPDYNRPTVEGVAGSASGTALLAAGMLIQDRNNTFGYIRDVSVFGREGYYYYPTDARFVSHYLRGQTVSGVAQLDPTGFANGNWAAWYRNLKNGENLIATADAQASLSAPQKAAVKGFARTFQALALYRVAVTRDSIGAPVEVPSDVSQPAPFVSRDAVWERVSALLEQAKADLAGGGASFPFALNSGFAGFDTPATFLKFNRALAARVFANRGSLGCAACYGQALTALGESFIRNATSRADLDVGVYHIYSTANGDALNGMNNSADPNLLAHAVTVTTAQKNALGVTDDRVTRKIAKLATPRGAPGSGNGIPAEYFFTVYATTTTPVAIIRNEELLLIRAEANLQTGKTTEALADINMVRTVSGGLSPLTSLGSDPIGTLLYERQMSLLLEGHRWNDMRRFKRLAQLPLDLSNHFVARVMPIPKDECDARLPSQRPAVGC